LKNQIHYSIFSIFLDTYNETKILYLNNTDHDITKLIDSITQDTKLIEEYDGNFANLMNIAPHIAAFNINDYNLPRLNLTVTYNDTMQHSLPILINILSNAYYRWVYQVEKIKRKYLRYLDEIFKV